MIKEKLYKEIRNDLPLELQEMIESVLEMSSPESIFLYGSRSRTDFLPTSDYEVGVFYNEENMADELTLHSNLTPEKRFRIYPYNIADFTSGVFDLPFETSIFLRIVGMSGKTIWGEEVIEKMKLPPITIVSIMREIKFQIGRASDAIVCDRRGDNEFSAELFYKSCLLGTRDLVILNTRRFPVSYKEILADSMALDLCEYANLPLKAYNSRLNKQVDSADLLSNIWYLNRYIEKQIMDTYKKSGDMILVL